MGREWSFGSFFLPCGKTNLKERITDLSYKIKEIFYTLQGEGFHAGRAAVFVRFSGCNLWSGREEDRQKAICQFCDTEFVGTDGQNGGTYSTDQLIRKIKELWPNDGSIFIVCTGGEPLLQLDQELVDALRKNKIYIAVETNGTKLAPKGIDWICVSPKANAPLLLTKGHELKLVFPQKGIQPSDFEHLDFEHFFLQPMAGHWIKAHTHESVLYCLAHPKWKISVQLHKILGID
ncbi:MAG TPA: 7-carboxy-7-deazaguanine synthase [Saprospiraceae bacterium]|nr:7-carboxy-7-deazaguanine synthase [Saprospiraceae bacterium]